jgi:hypothetical protein
MKAWLRDNKIAGRLPGWIAKSLMILLTGIWSYWGAGEMYHEGWWGAWYNPLLYLLPAAIFLTLTLVSLSWPRFGGTIIAVFGVAAGLIVNAIPIGLIIVIVGGLFWLEGRRIGNLPTPLEAGANRWWFRLAVIPPILIFIGASAYMLPIVLTRVDDGDRSARVIDGNGVSLVWAPEGPGWNWQQPWGGYVSWDSVALYGAPPVGVDWKSKPGYGRLDGGTWHHASAEDMTRTNLCLYLSEDGLTLMDEPQHIWRMPTVDEYVRSFARHGENAGCAWRGENKQRVTCNMLPDKETPLWAPNLAPIYYWAAEEYDERDAYFVSYNGFVNAAGKSSANTRHSYRCVKEVDSTE